MALELAVQATLWDCPAWEHPTEQLPLVVSWRFWCDGAVERHERSADRLSKPTVIYWEEALPGREWLLLPHTDKGDDGRSYVVVTCQQAETLRQQYQALPSTWSVHIQTARDQVALLGQKLRDGVLDSMSPEEQRQTQKEWDALMEESWQVYLNYLRWAAPV